MNEPTETRRKLSLRDYWLAVRLAWAEARDDYGKTLGLLQEFEGKWPLKLKHRALKGMLLLRTGDPDGARALLLQVREEASQKDDPDSRYIRRYAQYWLSAIIRDPFDQRRQSREAAEIPCRPGLKRFLWLPSHDVPDPLDAEFDAWMEKNAPREDDLRKRRIAEPDATMD